MKAWHANTVCSVIVERFRNATDEEREVLVKVSGLTALFRWNTALPRDRIACYENLCCTLLLLRPQEYGDSIFAEIQNEEWLSEHTKRCPRCLGRIEVGSLHSPSIAARPQSFTFHAEKRRVQSHDMLIVLFRILVW